jgi:hypothetical protein
VSSRAGRRRADSRSAFSSIVIVANFASEHFWAQPGRDNPSSREFEPPGLERPRPARRICDRNCEAFGWTIKSFVGSRQPAWRNRTRATVPTAGSNKEPNLHRSQSLLILGVRQKNQGGSTGFLK